MLTKKYVYHIKENNQITTLKHEESYKDLGVTFDGKLTFRDRDSGCILSRDEYTTKFIKHVQCL